MYRFPFTSLVLLSLLLVPTTGCQTGFDGTIEFRNKSPKRLLVSVDGFQLKPPVGVLVAGGSATSDLGRMDVPRQVIVTWRSDGQEYTSSVVSLTNLPSRITDGTIVFEFTEINRWSVKYEKE